MTHKAGANGHAVAEFAESVALGCSIRLALSTTRWAEWKVVIPALDFEDQLGSARLTVVRPSELLGRRLLIVVATKNENGHSGRRRTWKRKRVLRRKHVAAIRSERDDALESRISQGRQLCAAAAQGVALDGAP